VHFDSSIWEGATPFYSWGADCLDDACEYVAIFIGTAPSGDVPIARHWKVQTSDAIGGLLLARRLDEHRFEVIGTTHAGQSSDHPLTGPLQDVEGPHIFRYEGPAGAGRHELWEIDLQTLTITRLPCDGPTGDDSQPVWS
jgi:hypothetical protein